MVVRFHSSRFTVDRNFQSRSLRILLEKLYCEYSISVTYSSPNVNPYSSSSYRFNILPLYHYD
ncbi:hypothetical protein BLOT_004090 [Blomia tropicalis]|nr:hypothetical protein BLOT_004090 [Blomia tropicalis]